MRALLARLFIAVALVLFQHGAVVHAVGHLESAKRQHDGETKKTHSCELCLAYAAGDVPETPSQAFAFLDATRAVAVAHAAGPACIAVLSKPFLSQAPPAS